MFERLFDIFKKEEPKLKITVNSDLDYVIRNSKQGKEVKGIDKSKLALISVRKEAEHIAVSVEFERDLGSELFTETHKTIVKDVDDAIFFFTRFGIVGELSWIGSPRYHRRVSLKKVDMS